MTGVSVDVDGAAFRVAAFQDSAAEGVEDIVLDGALERAGTINGVIAMGGHQLGCGIAELHLETAGCEALVYAGQLDVDNALEVSSFQAVEDDDFINAVEELGAEMGAQRFHGSRVAAGHICLIEDEVAADVAEAVEEVVEEIKEAVTEE